MALTFDDDQPAALLKAVGLGPSGQLLAWSSRSNDREPQVQRARHGGYHRRRYVTDPAARRTVGRSTPQGWMTVGNSDASICVPSLARNPNEISGGSGRSSCTLRPIVSASPWCGRRVR